MKICINFLKNCLMFANYSMQKVTFITDTVIEVMVAEIYVNLVNIFMTMEQKCICLLIEIMKRNS